VVWNLLSNAVKFTPNDGCIDVLLESIGTQLQVVIKDSGAGIDPELLPYVFERFRQADSSTTRRHGGLGLGLSIVKRLVELHAGDVRVESAGREHGTSFIVTLPMAPAMVGGERGALAMASARSLAGDEIDLAGVKVLVVDDERDARELVGQVLIEAHAEVVMAASAAEARQLLETYRPDVIVSDIGMPGEDGYQFICSLRKLPLARGGRIPAIALTAYARSEDRIRAMRSGFQVHVSKPVEPPELTAAVAGLAGRTATAPE
jgi:CheY-like chemotaxis protein